MVLISALNIAYQTQASKVSVKSSYDIVIHYNLGHANIISNSMFEETAFNQSTSCDPNMNKALKSSLSKNVFRTVQ